jgi:DNA polymerase-3 subunit gamma/tau
MLYQEVRPSSFDEVVGNKTTVSALKKVACRNPKDRPHTFLFSGPTGCGKTTLARILSKELGCFDGNVIELNAANTRGIDTTREIHDFVHADCFNSGPKCFIFDECHELTASAQEALLKILEDTPENCYFIFCTTEPKSLIPTIRNRCTEYEVCKIGVRQIEDLLDHVCTVAGIVPPVGIIDGVQTTPQDLIGGIAAVSDGSPRTALVLLEKVNGLTVEEAIEILSMSSDSENTIQDLCKLLIQSPELRVKNFSKIMGTFDKINEDSERIRKYMMAFLAGKMSSFASKNKIDECRDIKHLMEVFSENTFYGGRSQLCAMMAKSCL